MIHKKYTIPDISCGHCVATIQRELALLPGVQNAAANADTKLLTLDADNDETVREAERLLAEIGYPPVT